MEFAKAPSEEASSGAEASHVSLSQIFAEQTLSGKNEQQ